MNICSLGFWKRKFFSLIDLTKQKYFKKKWYSSLLTFNYTSAEDLCFLWIVKKLFHPHQEILFFLFYNLLKSANIPTLFSYTFDTTIHAHTSTFIHTYTLPVGSLLHVMANMLESNIVVSFNSSHAIKFTFGLIPFKKIWAPLFPQIQTWLWY